MDIRKIKKLIELLEESSLTEIEIVEGEESVRLSRGGMAAHGHLQTMMPPGVQAAAWSAPSVGSLTIAGVDVDLSSAKAPALVTASLESRLSSSLEQRVALVV